MDSFVIAMLSTASVSLDYRRIHEECHLNASIVGSGLYSQWPCVTDLKSRANRSSGASLPRGTARDHQFPDGGRHGQARSGSVDVFGPVSVRDGQAEVLETRLIERAARSRIDEERPVALGIRADGG
jgi:hypothetical protein